MIQEQAENSEAEAQKKARKAEIKAAEKTKKAAKAERKLAKLAEKAAKAASKADRKAKKPETDTALVETGVAEESTPKKSKPKKIKAKSVAPTAMSLGAKLQAVARMARSNLAGALLEHGLYAGQEQVLFLLDENGPQALAELAERLDIRAPTITKTVTRMEAQGFLSRAVSREDARSIIISLTPEGRRVMKIGRDIVRDVEQKTFSILSKTECESLEGLLSLVFSQPK